MNPISFMTANYVARQSGYHMTDWGQAEQATVAWMRPIETFAARFGGILDDIRQMGFDHIDLWLGHLHPRWATEEHIAAAQAALAARGLQVSSLAGGFGATPAEFEQFCRLANAMGTRILGGGTPLTNLDAAPDDRRAMIRLCEQYDVIMAIENHPEKTPAEVLAKIGSDSQGHIATCVDTGIWANYDYDPLRAIEELAPHIVHVHLKDCPAVGSNASCGYGHGIVPLRRCVERLLEQGYTGGFSVEHEPAHADPTIEVVESLAMLKSWLGEQLC